MKKGLRKAAVSLTMLLLLSKMLGLVRDSLLAYRFGTSNVVDSYTICLSYANIALSLFTIGFSESYVTVYSRIPSERRRNFFNNTVTVIFVGSCAIGLLGCLFGNTIAYIMAPGFDAETHLIATVFLRIVSAVIPFQALFAIVSANESVRENFVFPRFCDFIIINFFIIITILVADFDRVYILPIGYLIANIIAVFTLIVYSVSNGDIKYNWRLQIKDADFRVLLSLALPLGLSFIINDLNTMTDGMFASTVRTGMTSALNYANKIQALFLAITVNIISVVCFPRVARHFASGEKDNALYYLRKSIMIAAFIAIPFMVLLLFFSPLVVDVLFKRGSFTEESSVITSTCLSFYCVGIPFYAMSNVENQALAANAKQKAILIITGLSVGFNILLDYILLNTFGYIGLPIATCCAGVLQFFLMMYELRKMNIHLFRRKETIEIVKMVLSIAVAAIIPIVFLNKTTTMINSFFLAIGMMVVYIFIGKVIRIEIENWLLSALFKRNK